MEESVELRPWVLGSGEEGLPLIDCFPITHILAMKA